MGHIILIKTSFFLGKTHFLIKLRGAALGSSPGQAACWFPPACPTRSQGADFHSKSCAGEENFQIWWSVSVQKSEGSEKEVRALGCSHKSSSRAASSGVSALGQKLSRCGLSACVCLQPTPALGRECSAEPRALSYLSHEISSMHGLHKAVF